MSPYLFLLCMEKLSLHIQDLVDMGLWKPIHLARNSPGISHLLFADDILLFAHANVTQVQVISEAFHNFSAASGLKVNLDKSRMLCSKKVSRVRRDQFTAISQIRSAASLGKYLGVNLGFNRNKTAHFHELLEKVDQRLSAWKLRMLNRAGKLCLIKSVVTAIPVYEMQVSWIPQSICNRIDQACRRFLWSSNSDSKGWHLVNWQTITAPRNDGGLGIRDARKANTALLGKLSWKMLSEPDRLWVQVVSSVYLRDTSFMDYNIRGNVSYTWRSIIRARDCLAPCFSFFLQRGNSSLWYKDWSGLGKLCDLVPFVHISDTTLTVGEVWDNGWNFDRLYTCLPDTLRNNIAALCGPSKADFDDAWRWNQEPHGHFTSRSAYAWLNRRAEETPEHQVWNQLWHLKVAEKCKFMVWLGLHQALPVNARRHACSMAASAGCGRCSATVEDILHCLRDCPHSKEVWNRLGCGSFGGFFSADGWSWLLSIMQQPNVEKLVYILWWIWRWRNNMALGTELWNIEDVLRFIQRDWNDLTLSVDVHAITPTWRTWQPPDVGWVKLNTDGSCSRGLAHIGCGGVIRDHSGKWLWGFSSYEGHGDAYMAELLGVVRGLQQAWQRGFRRMICETDCLSVIESLNSNRTLNLHSCGALLTEVKCLIMEDWEVVFQHVTRDKNVVADSLAKLGVEKRWSLTCWSSPPTEFVQLRDLG